MGRFVLFISVLFISAVQPVPAETTWELTLPDTLVKSDTPSVTDKWFAPDKAHHLMASAFLTGFGYYSAKQELNQSQYASQQIAVGFSLSLGLAKEAYDKYGRGGHASVKDIVADLVGITLGIVLINASTK